MFRIVPAALKLKAQFVLSTVDNAAVPSFTAAGGDPKFCFVADFARPHLRLCFLSVVASRKSQCVAVGVLVRESKVGAERY